MLSVSVSELRAKLQDFVNKAQELPVVITTYGAAVAVLVSAKRYDALCFAEKELAAREAETAALRAETAALKAENRKLRLQTG
jgi:prevent-host-death family protein